MAQQPLGTIPVASTAFIDDPVLSSPGGSVELLFRWESEGRLLSSGFRFVTTRAHRHRAESHCTAWHISNAYDTLVEVTSSDWVQELRQAQPLPRREWEMHHYLIFLDGAGAFEVVAASWTWLPVVRQ